MSRGWKGSGGSGTATPTVSVSVAELDPGTIRATIGSPSGGTMVEWALEYKKTTDATWTTISGITGTTRDVTGLDAVEYQFRVVPTVEIDGTSNVAAITVSAPTSPTVPTRKAIIGRGMSNYEGNGGFFEAGQNDATYWGYSFYEVPGPTRITVKKSIVNETGKAVKAIAIPFETFFANPAEILAVWASVDNGTTWTRLLFDGLGTKTPPAGTLSVPGFTATDTTLLSGLWLAEATLLVRVVFENSGQIPSVDSFGTLKNAESGMSTVVHALGDGGSDEAALSNPLTDTVVPVAGVFPHIFVVYDDLEDVEISVLAWGDSVNNQFRVVFDPVNPACRDGMWYQLDLVRTAGYRVAPGGRGGLNPVEYLASLLAAWSVYAPWIDGVLWQGYSTNGAPPSGLTAQQVKDTMDAASVFVTEAGKAFLISFLGPIGVAYTYYGAPALAAFEDILAHANTNYPGQVVDIHEAAQDPENIPHYLASLTVDDEHTNQAGAVVQGQAIDAPLVAGLQWWQYSP